MTRKYFIALLAPILFFVPLISSAATLSQNQVDAVISLLTSFGVDSSTIANVRASLTDSASATMVAGSTTPSPYVFSQDLTVGKSGADVIALQNLLISKGYLSGSATGYFGILTKKAVARWQKAVGISAASGYIDATSRAALNSSPSTSVTDTTSTTASTNTVAAMTQAQLDAQNAALGRTQFNTAPVVTSPPPATINNTPTAIYANSCNGSPYPACLSGSHFVCLSSSPGYCIQDTIPVTQPAQIIPQATQSVAPVVPTTTKSQPSVSVSLAPPSPTQNVVAGTLGVKWASFNIVASGENVRIGDLNIHAVTKTNLGALAGVGGLKNGKVFLNGVQVAPTKDIRPLDQAYPLTGLPPTSFEFNSQFVLPIGQTVILDIYADAKDISGIDLPANSTAAVVLDVGGGQSQLSLYPVNFPSTAISGNSIAVVSSGSISAQQTAQCQQQYNQALLSLGDGGVQNATNNYNDVVTQTYQIINNCGASGTCFSGTRNLAQQQLDQAKAKLDDVTAQYQTSLGILKNTLQTCLGN